MSQILQQIDDRVYHGRPSRVRRLVREALDLGLAPRAILDEGLLAAMQRVVQDFQRGELCESEVLQAAEAVRAGRAVLRPLLPGAPAVGAGRSLIGALISRVQCLGKKLSRILRRE